MTLHDDARSVLAGWTPPTPEQRALRDAYLDHLAARPDAMWRACHPDHLTASVVVFSADHASVLLTLHQKLGRWLQTGGHCETSDVTLVAAALREGREETGLGDLAIDPTPVLLSRHEVPCGPVAPAHHLDVQFVAVAAHDAVPVMSEESSDLAWFACDDLPADTDDSVRELVSASERRLRESPARARPAGSD